MYNYYLFLKLLVVNLESKNTSDYKNIIGEGEPDIPKIQEAYYQRHYELLDLIMHSAMIKTKPGETANIFSALLGAGCFVKALDDNLKDVVLQEQLLAMNDVLEKYIKKSENGEFKFHFNLRIFRPGDFTNQLMGSYKDLQTQYSDHFSVGFGPKDGNILLNIPYGDPKIQNFIVNAGDPRSFIGNGMSKDKTVEGFLCGNAGGFNNQYRNTCFLHNPRFNPNILNPRNWVHM